MPVREFALYTLAFSVVTFFNFLSDLGSTSSLLHFFHRVGPGRGGLRAVPRRRAVAAPRRVPAGRGGGGDRLPLRGRGSRGSAGPRSPLVTAGILVCVWFQIQASIRILALRLRDRYAQSYRAEVGGTLLRLPRRRRHGGSPASSWPGSASRRPRRPPALSAAIARPGRPERPPRPEDLGRHRRQILRYLLPTLPSALYFSVQGPLTIWLSATFGIDAHPRRGGGPGPAGADRGDVLGPHRGRLPAAPGRVRTTGSTAPATSSTDSLLAGVVAALLAAAALVPRLFLLVLGPHYRGPPSRAPADRRRLGARRSWAATSPTSIWPAGGAASRG